MNVPELSRRNVLIVGTISFVLGLLFAMNMNWDKIIGSERRECELRGGTWAVVDHHTVWTGKSAAIMEDYACVDPRSRK